ncbi:uncharacterized protein CTRU02_206575 [Colletotrichum truncatum]|uniref:Uncharacterized protein n=1 Tax=Colletotrichum truncatum TaxID=5467 RepID=A0ACC3Z7C3_COLTU
MLATKPLPVPVRLKRTKTGVCPLTKARKKCCEQKPQCARCSLKGLGCVYDFVEKPRPKYSRKTSPGSQRARHTLRGHRIKPEEGFMHTFEVAKPTVAQSPERKKEACTPPSQLDMDLCNMDIDESLDFFENLGSSSDSEACSLLTNNITDDSASARSLSVDPSSLPLELQFPAFSDFADDSHSRKLLQYFCDTLSHLIVFVEEPNNSFQSLVVPLAYPNSPVLHAICAFTSRHLENIGIQNDRHSSEYQTMAAKGAFELVRWRCQHEEVLATLMLLVYYESLTSSNTSEMAIGHLQAAFLVLSSTPESERTESIRFLEKAFHYYDVISALSLGISPVSAVPMSDYTYPLAVLPPPRQSNGAHGDPFLGAMVDLWPVLYRLTMVGSLKEELDAALVANENRKAAVLQVEFEATTKAIEKALQDWQPAINNKDVVPSTQEEEARVLAMGHNSLAYRHSALLYLHRSIYGYPMKHPDVQKSIRLSLENCAAVVTSGGPVNALLWPLFVAAYHAVTDDDQGLAKVLFAEIERRQGMSNVGGAREVVFNKWAAAGVDSIDYGDKTWTGITRGMEHKIIMG